MGGFSLMESCSVPCPETHGSDCAEAGDGPSPSTVDSTSSISTTTLLQASWAVSQNTTSWYFQSLEWSKEVMFGSPARKYTWIGWDGHTLLMNGWMLDEVMLVRVLYDADFLKWVLMGMWRRGLWKWSPMFLPLLDATTSSKAWFGFVTDRHANTFLQVEL